MIFPRPVLQALAALHLHGFMTERLEVTRLTVTIAGLPPEFEGVRLAHVSDIHVGEDNWLPVHAEEAAERVREERPDLVINTGDFLQEQPDIEKVKRFIAPFVQREEHESPALDAVAILGNHDYFADQAVINDLKRGLSEVGMHVLENQRFDWHRGGSVLSFVGITHHAPGLEHAIQLLSEAPRPRIALIHEPDLVDWLPHGVADLVLAGHTHGGQITVPGLAVPIAKRFGKTAYGDGFYNVNGMVMFVNRGLGTTGLPLRFRARPEVAFIRLVR